MKGSRLNSEKQQIPRWVWVIVTILAVVLITGQIRSCAKQDAKKALQQMLLQNYGDAIQDYRSDPIRFRARVQDLVRRGEVSQQEANEFVELVRKMSQTVP